ncbi:MAG TPA: hypothetical protein VG147_04725 [Solirubrobacteraceae bacterium]|jgi:hypothetical protein|nr:hypothetical protein [Solirubrobacteraceae bacterium]
MPELSADLAFTRAIPLDVSPPVEALVASNLFRTHFNTAMYCRLGAAPELSFVARQLRATNIIEQDVARRLRAANHPIHGTRTPFKVIWNGQAAEMALTTKVFPPDVLVVTVHVKGIQVEEDRLVESLVSAQQGLPERLLPDLQRILGAIIVSADRNTGLDNAPRLVGSTWPTTLLRVDVPPNDIADWVDERWSPLCAAVIRDADYKTSDERIIAGLRHRNSELNAKGGFRRLLDKQGGLLVAAASDRARANTEFKRLVDLQTIGLVLRSFFALYPRARLRAPAMFDFLLAKAVEWVTEPERVLRESVTSANAWSLAASELKLSHDAKKLLEVKSTRARLRVISDETGELNSDWWLNPGLAPQLESAVAAARLPKAPAAKQIVHIAHAAEVQVALGDITNYTTFAEFTAAVDTAIDGLVGVDETAKAEAKGILAKMCSKGGEVASAAAGSAGGSLLGAVLKQILGLP